MLVVTVDLIFLSHSVFVSNLFAVLLSSSLECFGIVVQCESYS